MWALIGWIEAPLGLMSLPMANVLVEMFLGLSLGLRITPETAMCNYQHEEHEEILSKEDQDLIERSFANKSWQRYRVANIPIYIVKLVQVLYKHKDEKVFLPSLPSPDTSM